MKGQEKSPYKSIVAEVFFVFFARFSGDQSVTINERFPNPDLQRFSLFSPHISFPSTPFFLARIPSSSSYAPRPLHLFAFFPILFFLQESSKQNIPQREYHVFLRRTLSGPSFLFARSPRSFNVCSPCFTPLLISFLFFDSLALPLPNQNAVSTSIHSLLLPCPHTHHGS